MPQPLTFPPQLALNVIPPATWSLFAGAVVPMPTLPEESMAKSTFDQAIPPVPRPILLAPSVTNAPIVVPARWTYSIDSHPFIAFWTKLPPPAELPVLISPRTCSLDSGPVVPMPTLPEK